MGLGIRLGELLFDVNAINRRGDCTAKVGNSSPQLRSAILQVAKLLKATGSDILQPIPN